MNFGGVFVENAHKKQEYKYTDARIKANQKYANSRWRPNVFIDANKRETIETWLSEQGYKSINAYLLECLRKDGVIE